MIGTETRVKKQTNGSAGLKEGISEALRDAADSGFERSQELIAQQSVDTGRLLQSGVPPKLMADGSIQWGYLAPYSRYVEFGTEPHYPPIEPLKGWARRVLGDESAAYAIQRKIAQEGTQAQPFFRPGVETMRTRLRALNVESRVKDNL